MARVTAHHLADVRAKVQLIRTNLQRGRSALAYTGPEAILLQANLKFEESPTIPASPFDYRKLRAEYFWRGKHITLKTFPAPPDVGGVTVGIGTGFEQWVVPVLAHEVCHLLQHRADPKLFDAGGCGAKADELKKAYQASKTWANYRAYVSHILELEAHATQMAVEVLLTHGKLNEAAFLQAARSSDLANHIRSHAQKGTDEDKTISAEAEDLVDRLAAEGWVAYLLL